MPAPGPTQDPAQPARYVEHVMGMAISLAVRGRHTRGAALDLAWDSAMEILRDADRVFSTYRPDSFVSRINRGEIGLADCPPEVAEVLALGEAAERDSDGAFSVWLPGPDGRTRLDPSGVVKGWAADRAAMPLRELEDTDFCLSAGGDITCRTLDTDGPAWRIGIEAPSDPRGLLAVVPIYTGAVATSGTSRRGQHLFDARTGRPPAGIAQVTVIAGSLTWADIDATAAYAQGVDAARWLRGRTGRGGLVALADGTTVVIDAQPG